MTDEQRANIKTMPTNRAQIDAFNFLRASANDLKESQPILRKRLGLIPGGWRNLRMLTVVLENLCNDITLTFEPEKRQHIIRNGDRMKHKLVIGPPVTKEQDDYVLGADDMSVLLLYASKQCGLCIASPSECKQCRLGKTMDRISFISRQDRAWWEVFERSKRTDIGENPGYNEE